MQILLAILPYLIVLSLIAVVVTLFLGIGGMAKGGEFNKHHGNRMMRLRVGFQALAVTLIALYYWLGQG